MTHCVKKCKYCVSNKCDSQLHAHLQWLPDIHLVQFKLPDGRLNEDWHGGNPQTGSGNQKNFH